MAEAAGVSIKTVSNVVNDHPHVRPEMRAKVKAFIAELDYRPNGIGRQLRQGRTGLVALALPDVTSPYFGELASALVNAARERGLTLLVEQTDGDPDREREVATGFPVRLVDGLVFVPQSLPVEELKQRRDSTPAVLIGEYGQGSDFDRVTIDSVDLGDQASRHLLDLGRRTVALLGDKARGEVRPPVVAQRVEGYRRALRRAGVAFDPDLLRPLPEWTRQHGYDGTLALVADRPDVDAIFAANDLVAFGALHALRRLGLRVPEDVAVVGVDDVEQAQFAAPTLTSVALDRSEMARLALGLLADRLAGHDGPERLLTVSGRLVVRESTAG
ncbi:LacI family DNA-binding transcriptional regulator [Kineococcus rhizosphaerae]|uniref:LacI family transcriptional regulator n=1 Tax=Kineococcus rhizosphaerae TaxID=559628 RepID=A0A2T0R4R1_9ACTN|nr:LacI family DNA-binding transcriptional regulator [Kineococcus rhizosphaerae]PRY15292.1 LacI family transcriptional regulator [Kineococcus rhizosphaerae]